MEFESLHLNVVFSVNISVLLTTSNCALPSTMGQLGHSPWVNYPLYKQTPFVQVSYPDISASSPSRCRRSCRRGARILPPGSSRADSRTPACSQSPAGPSRPRPRAAGSPAVCRRALRWGGERIDETSMDKRRGLTWRRQRLCVRMHSGCVPLQVRSGWQVLEEEPWIKCPGWHWKDTTLPTCGEWRTVGNICEKVKEKEKKNATGRRNVKSKLCWKVGKKNWARQLHSRLQKELLRHRKLLPGDRMQCNKWKDGLLPDSTLYVASMFCLLGSL